MNFHARLAIVAKLSFSPYLPNSSVSPTFMGPLIALCFALLAIKCAKIVIFAIFAKFASIANFYGAPSLLCALPCWRFWQNCHFCHICQICQYRQLLWAPSMLCALPCWRLWQNCHFCHICQIRLYVLFFAIFVVLFCCCVHFWTYLQASHISKKALKANNYPDWMITLPNAAPVSRVSEESVKERGIYASVPYIKGTSERLQRAFKSHEITLIHKPFNLPVRSACPQNH